jgi:prepilin-type N-terminal cleavage/methylation domain-containing protein
MHDTRYRIKNHNGFTLLEIILVLFLMAFILGLSTIFFANTLPSSRLYATAREISATIRHARHLALINGDKQTMTINLDSRNYGIEGIAQKNIPSGITLKVTDPLLGDIHKGEYPFIFHATGAMEGGTIVLSTEKKTVSIQLDPVVGSVVIK